MIVNLRESLNTRDRKSVNGNSKYYDLVNLYESCNLSADNKKTLAKMINNNASDKAIYSFLYECYEGKEDIKEDTVKKDGKWVNKGKEGTHGEFKTKKAADAQRKAMFANGYKGESLKESTSIYRDYNGIMGNPGATWTIKELKAYWETNHNSDPVLNEYKSMQSWLNDTIAMLHPVTNDEYDESLKESSDSFDCDEIQTYSVVRVGGSIGEKSFVVVKSGLSKEEANEYAKARMKSLSPGEKKYYGIKYKVVPDEKSSAVSSVEESLNDGVAVKMSRDDFDRMCRENSILQGLSSRDYEEIRDSFNIGYENFDAAVNDLWDGDGNYHSRDWYEDLLKKYTNSVNESLKEKLNLNSEGKALKRAIKNIVVDNDNELREFVSAVVEEVISERNSFEESLKESLESEDGWSEEILDIVDPFFVEVETVAYELRNTVRGAYRFGTTVKDLAQVFRGFSETADDIANELDDNQEHLEEDWCSIKEEPHEECIGNNCTDENDLFPEEKYFTIVVTRSDDGEDEIIDDVTKEIADKYIDDLKRDNDEFFSHAKVLDHNGEVVNSWEYLEEAAKSKKSSSIKDRLKKLIPDLDI